MLTQAVQHVQGRPSVPSGYPRAIPTGSVAWPRPGITVRRTQTPRTKTLEPTVTERSVTDTFALGHIVPVPPALVFPLALSLAGAVVPPALALVLAGAGLPPARLGDGGPRCLVLSLASDGVPPALASDGVLQHRRHAHELRQERDVQVGQALASQVGQDLASLGLFHEGVRLSASSACAPFLPPGS